ncbi:hypothetical protein BT63DRAFT_57742 [Microthyrium microscopicum]|uniref:Rhodopsin domain-containing protein n=1 Tax=Microthyrium microscopicum TaxID=703497 RepID=A0A6A6U5J1_9PEZI|nr:hypothetical protein BT63DRAFT_57742 [Microthyrium microscopicum]
MSLADFKTNPPTDNGILTPPPPGDPAWSTGRREWMLPFALVIEIVTTVLLVIRIFSRISKLGGQAGVDDILIVIAWLLGAGVTACCIYGSKRLGWDVHMMYSPAGEWHLSALVTIIAEEFFVYSLLCTKFSVLMFYRRLVKGTYSVHFKWALWFGMFLAVASSVIPTVLSLTSCTPFKANWWQWDIGYVYANAYHFHCRKVAKKVLAARVSGALSVITDFYSVMLPAVLLLRIRINKRQRWGLIAVFSVGYCVVAAGCVRTYYLSIAEEPIADKSWTLFQVWAASLVECNVAIICACAPSLKSVTGRFFRDLSSKGGSNSKGSSETPSTSTYNSDEPLKKKVEVSYNSKVPSQSQVSKRGIRNWHFGSKRDNVQDDMYYEDPDADMTSFIKTHEYGIDPRTSVAEAYDHDLVTRFESNSSSDAHDGEISLSPRLDNSGFALANYPATPPPTYSAAATRQASLGNIDQHTRATASSTQQIQSPSNQQLSVASSQHIPSASNARIVYIQQEAARQAPTEEEHSGTSSFIFFDGNDGAERVVRGRHSDFLESSTTSSEYDYLSFPVMNPVISRTQSLRDAAELARQQALTNAASTVPPQLHGSRSASTIRANNWPLSPHSPGNSYRTIEYQPESRR